MTTRHRDEQGVVAPSRLMLVAIVVVAVAGAMFVATSPGSDDSAAAKGSSASKASSPTARSSVSAPSSSTPSRTPSSTPSKAATKKPSASPSAQTKPSSAPVQAVKRAATRVSVFNNSGKKGLAKRTARKVSGVGWKVVGTDNWYGTIPTSTVYYPKKLQAAAKVLARDLGIARIKPAIKPMRSDRLTVILTTDYTA